MIAPLLMMGTYVFSFTVLFRGRLGPTDNGLGYVAYVLAGLSVWMGVSESLSRSSGAISGNANLVKQIVFPNEILPLKVALATLPGMGIALAVTGLVSAVHGSLTLFGLFVALPVALFFYILMMAGTAFILGALGVFVRDIKDIVAFVTSVGLLLHPIFYPPGSTPAWLSHLFQISPVSHMIWCFRDALIGFDPAHRMSWAVFPLLSVLVFVAGWRLFQSLKPVFGNAL